MRQGGDGFQIRLRPRLHAVRGRAYLRPGMPGQQQQQLGLDVEAGLFMRSLTGNPMDVHLHTSANLRRWLLRLDGLNIKTKLLLLMTWHTGPEVRSTANCMEPWPQPDQTAVAKLPHRSQDELLDAIRHSIYTQPPTDWSKVTNLGVMRAVPEVKETVNLAQQYVNLRYDPQAFIARLAEIVCHDNFTEMQIGRAS